MKSIYTPWERFLIVLAMIFVVLPCLSWQWFYNQIWLKRILKEKHN